MKILTMETPALHLIPSLFCNLQNNDGIIVIQMDDMTKEALLKKGSSVSNRWSLWLVIASMERMLISVTWRPSSSGTEATRMTCVMCRNDVSRLCRYEIACEIECLNDCDDLESGNGRNDSASDAGNGPGGSTGSGSE